MRRSFRKALAVLLTAAIAFSSVPAASVEAASFVEDIVKGLLSDGEEIDYVKNAFPEAYPNISFGEAFDGFFANPRWTSFVSDDGIHVVEFKGDCLYAEQEVTAHIQYTLDLDNGTFEPNYVGLNDVPQTMLMYTSLMEAAFEDAASSGNALSDESLHELVNDYLIEDGDKRYITEEDICFMDSTTLELARNEFYARHGRKFATESIQEYFNQQPWYSGTVEPEDFTDDVFNEYERANIDFIVAYENEAGSENGVDQNIQGAYDFVVGRTFHLLDSQRTVEFTDSGEFIVIGYYGSSPLMNKYCTYSFGSGNTLDIDGEEYGFSYGDGMIYLSGNGEFVGSYELI